MGKVNIYEKVTIKKRKGLCQREFAMNECLMCHEAGVPPPPSAPARNQVALPSSTYNTGHCVIQCINGSFYLLH